MCCFLLRLILISSLPIDILNPSDFLRGQGVVFIDNLDSFSLNVANALTKLGAAARNCSANVGTLWMESG
jgi:hypothetical protein